MNISSLNQLLKVVKNRPVTVELLSKETGDTYRLISKVTKFTMSHKEGNECVLLQKRINGKYEIGEGYVHLPIEDITSFTEIDALA